MKVALCICTFRRPEGLARLLDELTKLNGGVELEVVVADNDAGEQGLAEGLAVCASLSDDYPYPVHALKATEPGISGARNAACSKALDLDVALIAFLDDDEWPSPDWLSELLRVQAQHEADLVGGPTRSVFPEHVSPDLKNNQYYGADLQLEDGKPCVLQAAGNFLIKPDTLRSMAPEFFRHEFAHSGGEDLAFFTQLNQAGSQMHWAANAVVYEDVPNSRLDDSWLQQRVVNIHNSRVRVMQLLQPGFKHSFIRVSKTIALGGTAFALTLVSIALPRYREASRLLRWKFQGKLTAHFGLTTVRGETY